MNPEETLSWPAKAAPRSILGTKSSAQSAFVFPILCRDHYQMANLGYFVHNTYQGRGIGKEAVRAALNIAFTKLGYKRVEAAIYPDNRRSIALAKSLGMKREGLRKEYLHDEKGWEDHVVFVALNRAKRKSAYFML